MASWNAPIQTHATIGPKVVTIHGQAYHTTSNANPLPGHPRQFAQLYILDTTQALQERVSHPANVELRPDVLQILQDELTSVNPFAQQFRHMGRILEEQQQQAVADQTQLPPVRMVISHRPGEDARYSNPTASEIAAVYVGEEGAPPNLAARDITIYPSGTHNTIHINALSPNVDPMTYPLFFFAGQRGWGIDLHQTDIRDHQLTNKRITLAQYYAFRIAYRERFSTIHRGCLLFQVSIKTIFSTTCIRQSYLATTSSTLYLDLYSSDP